MPNRNHTYTFGFEGEPTIDQLIGELQVAANVMGGASKVRISAGDSQRDGYSFSAIVTGRITT